MRHLYTILFLLLPLICSAGDFPVMSKRVLSYPLPDGNYLLTVTIGSKKRAASTTIRCESRRLLCENVATRKGEITGTRHLGHRAREDKEARREQTQLGRCALR